jgi:hypothetical protein
MGATVALVVEGLLTAGVGSAGILVCGIATGVVVFVPLLLRLEPALIAELRGFARHGRGPTTPVDRVVTGNGGELVSGTHSSR